MIVAKLIDNIWATRKAENLNGYKLMLVEIVGGTSKGQRLVAVDIISAGIGDYVIVTTGSAARKMLSDEQVPVDAAIIAIIDEDCHLS